jgi:SAM-dependent methyltransferase
MTHESIDHIYHDGKQYDLLFTGENKDLPFWVSQAKLYGDPVLELGCGTGRVAMKLAECGFEVTGIDQSEAMLSEARRKAASKNLEVECLKADMRDFDLGRKFSLVILPGNALCHLLYLEDIESCFASVREHLLPGGRFIISVFVPKMELLLDKPGERAPFYKYSDPGGRGRIVVTESYVYEPDTQIKRITLHYAIPGEEEDVEGKVILKMYFPQELDALIKYNGFVIEHKYGGHDRAPFTAESETQLIVCGVAS